jgi:hypothetical protein
MADPLHQEAAGGACQFAQAGISRRAIRATELHLDQFMIVQGTLRFGDDRGRYSMLADQQHGVERMTETPQVLALAFREFHDSIVKIADTALTLVFAPRVLKPNGAVLIKTFQGAGLQDLVATARRSFNRVRFAKPDATCACSSELYLLASGFRMV